MKARAKPGQTSQICVLWGECTHTWACVCTLKSVGTLRGAIYSTE